MQAALPIWSNRHVPALLIVRYLKPPGSCESSLLFKRSELHLP